MKLFQVIAQNIEIMKGKSPVQDFYKDMRKQFEDYSESRSRDALDRIIKNFLDQPDYEIKQQNIDEAFDIAESTFLNMPLSMSVNLKRHNEKIYEYYRKPLRPIQKAEGDEEIKEPEIIKIDPIAINRLTQGNIVWIQNHAGSSALMNKLATSMKAWKLQKLSMWEIAEKLKTEYLDITPVSFKKRFAERDYWKLVTQNHTTRISSYANIDDYEAAGYEYYEWVTREDGVCPICEPMNGMIFKVSDARKRINDYYEAANIKDPKKAVKAMKAADPFLKVDEAIPPGIMPQVHVRCYCEIRPKKIMAGWVYDAENYKFIKEVA